MYHIIVLLFFFLFLLAVRVPLVGRLIVFCCFFFSLYILVAKNSLGEIGFGYKIMLSLWRWHHCSVFVQSKQIESSCWRNLISEYLFFFRRTPTCAVNSLSVSPVASGILRRPKQIFRIQTETDIRIDYSFLWSAYTITIWINSVW